MARYVPTVVRERYAAKLAIAFLTILVVMAAIGGYIYLSTGSALAADARAEIEGTATQHAEQLRRWVENSRHTAQQVADSRPVATGDPARIGDYASELVGDSELTAGARAIHYVNASTTEILSSSLERRIGGNPRSEGAPWAQQSLASLDEDDVRVTSFNPSVANATVMTFVTPVPGQDRAIVYVTSLAGVTAQLNQPADGAYTAVIDSDGRTVIDQHAPGSVGSAYAGELGGASEATGRASGSTTLEGSVTPEAYGSLVMGYRTIPSLNWVVLTHVPADEVFALRETISTNLVALLAAAVLGLAAIGVTIGRNTLRALSDLTAKAERMEAGDLDVDLATDRVDEIGQLYAAFDAMRESLTERISEAEQAKESAEAAQAEAEAERERSEQLVDHLETKAAEYQAVMEATAAGDLTQRMEPSSESAAMGEIAEAFNAMADEIMATLERIQAFADEVATASEEVMTSTEEIQSASHEVSESVQEIASGAEEQTEKLRSVAEEMQDLSGSIEEVASSADRVASTAETAAAEGDKGKRAAESAIDEMDEIQATTTATVEEVETLAEEVDEIGEIVELITEITEQTNLLALNASIEAARAEEAGEEFGVVADEIKSLAEDAAAATEEIETRIETIQASTDDTVADIRTMRDSVVDGMETVESALTALDDVVDHVESANHGMQEINEATDDQAASTEEATAVVDDVAGVARQASDEAEQVSAATEEQTSALSEVSGSVERLSERAGRLQELLADFETDAAAGQSTEDRGGAAAVADGSGQPDDRPAADWNPDDRRDLQ